MQLNPLLSSLYYQLLKPLKQLTIHTMYMKLNETLRFRSFLFEKKNITVPQGITI
jgi:hypothetical protein